MALKKQPTRWVCIVISPVSGSANGSRKWGKFPMKQNESHTHFFSSSSSKCNTILSLCNANDGVYVRKMILMNKTYRRIIYAQKFSHLFHSHLRGGESEPNYNLHQTAFASSVVLTVLKSPENVRARVPAAHTFFRVHSPSFCWVANENGSFITSIRFNYCH